jgi:hypothetical protein
MRATAVVLVLLLLAAIPVSGSQARDDGVDNALVLPPVQWNASVGIGYISTAPLVFGGLVIVKGGGDPMTGAGAGMVAYRADTGEQVWRANHTESTTGFEIAPLEVSWAWMNAVDCKPDENLIITGWTSGILTAHSLANGSEVWRIATAAPSWGITGGGIIEYGQVVWPTETGMVNVCSANGTLLNEYHDPDLRTYRAGLGIWMQGNTGSRGWLLGTEQARVLQFAENGTLLNDLDLVAAANLSGDWRIRSIPRYFGGKGLLAHLSGEGESRYVHFDWDWNGTADPILNTSITLAAGTATTEAGFRFYPPVGTSEGVAWYWPHNNSFQIGQSYEATNVAGEMTYIRGIICIPQNTAEGSWLLYANYNHSFEWIPDVPAYTTAGCGSDRTVFAVANDASWLEVRYSEDDEYGIGRWADQNLGVEPIIDEIPERPEVESKWPPQESIDPGADGQAVVWLPIWGAILVFLIGLMAPNKDLRRQIFGAASIMFVIGLIIAASVLNQALVETPEPDTSGRLTSGDLQNWQEEDGMVYVSFHYPEGFGPEGFGPEGCENQIYWITTSGSSVSTKPIDIADTEGSHCIELYPMAIGEASTVEQVTVDALYSSKRGDFFIEQQVMGPFLRDVGDAVGGTDDRWWTYDLNGGYGTLGMEYQTVVAGDHIDWHFDAGEF